MPHAEFGWRYRQVGVAASAVSVVAVVALLVHPGRDTAARNPERAGGPVTSSDSPLASPATSLPAVSFSEPAFSSAPAPSPTASNSPVTPPSTTPPVTRTSPTVPVAVDSQLNFKVSIQVAPTQVVVDQQVRVSVKVVNAGGVFDRPVLMWFGGSDPSDNFSDAPPTCTDLSGSVSCPITGVRPGRTWSFTLTFVPGPFPAVGHFDDGVFVAFNYTEGHGQPQETPQYYADVLLFDAPAVSSSPASGAPSNTPPPSAPPASPASTSATSAPQSAG